MLRALLSRSALPALCCRPAGKKTRAVVVSAAPTTAEERTLSLDLCRRLHGQVVSADSVQTMLSRGCIPLLVIGTTPDREGDTKGPQYLFSTRKTFIKTIVDQIEGIHRTELEKKRMYKKRLREVEKWRAKTQKKEEPQSSSLS